MRGLGQDRGAGGEIEDRARLDAAAIEVHEFGARRGFQIFQTVLFDLAMAARETVAARQQAATAHLAAHHPPRNDRNAPPPHQHGGKDCPFCIARAMHQAPTPPTGAALLLPLSIAVVGPLLLILASMLLYIEINTPGFGWPGGLAILFFVLFFFALFSGLSAAFFAAALALARSFSITCSGACTTT